MKATLQVPLRPQLSVPVGLVRVLMTATSKNSENVGLRRSADLPSWAVTLAFAVMTVCVCAYLPQVPSLKTSQGGLQLSEPVPQFCRVHREIYHTISSRTHGTPSVGPHVSSSCIKHLRQHLRMVSTPFVVPRLKLDKEAGQGVGGRISVRVTGQGTVSIDASFKQLGSWGLGPELQVPHLVLSQGLPLPRWKQALALQQSTYDSEQLSCMFLCTWNCSLSSHGQPMVHSACGAVLDLSGWMHAWFLRTPLLGRKETCPGIALPRRVLNRFRFNPSFKPSHK